MDPDPGDDHGRGNSIEEVGGSERRVAAGWSVESVGFLRDWRGPSFGTGPDTGFSRSGWNGGAGIGGREGGGDAWFVELRVAEDPLV